MTTDILFDYKILETLTNQRPSDDTMRILATNLGISRFTLDYNLNISDNNGSTIITTSLFPKPPHQKTGDPTTYQLENGNQIDFRVGISVRQTKQVG